MKLKSTSLLHLPVLYHEGLPSSSFSPVSMVHQQPPYQWDEGLLLPLGAQRHRYAANAATAHLDQNFKESENIMMHAFSTRFVWCEFES